MNKQWERPASFVPPHRARIVLNSDDELRFWLDFLGTDESNLRGAISSVGSEVDAVAEFLSRSR